MPPRAIISSANPFAGLPCKITRRCCERGRFRGITLVSRMEKGRSRTPPRLKYISAILSPKSANERPVRARTCTDYCATLPDGVRRATFYQRRVIDFGRYSAANCRRADRDRAYPRARDAVNRVTACISGCGNQGARVSVRPDFYRILRRTKYLTRSLRQVKSLD